MTRFCSEFGFESLPDIKTIQTFAKPEDYSLTSEVFSNHQKCASGNMKMAYYIADRFRLPYNFTDYIYLSGVCQQECIKDATEHWRRNKGQCNGSLFWQYNDCWPVCSWSSVDYYGNYKALQYTAKHFFAPVMVSLENTKEKVNVYIINDTMEVKNIKVILRLITFDGKVPFIKEIEQTAEPNSSFIIDSISMAELVKKSDIKQSVLVADLEVNGVKTNRKTLLFASEKNIKLSPTDVNIDIAVNNGMAEYTLSSNKYVRLLQLNSSENRKPFSDNYFDLLPNEKITVYQKLNGTADINELRKQVSVFGAGDIVPKGSKLSDFILRAKIFFIPINFLSWIFYKCIPKKIKVAQELQFEATKKSTGEK